MHDGTQQRQERSAVLLLQFVGSRFDSFLPPSTDRVAAGPIGRLIVISVNIANASGCFGAVISGQSMTGHGRLLTPRLKHSHRLFLSDFTTVATADSRPETVHRIWSSSTNTLRLVSVRFRVRLRFSRIAQTNHSGFIHTNLPSAEAAKTCGTMSVPIPSATTNNSSLSLDRSTAL
jgi:hypothetical protein